MKKEQFMALVEPDTLYRLDRLRIVGGQSRARVGEDLIRAALPGAEEGEADGIVLLEKIAKRLKVSPEQLVRWYATTYTRQYGPGLAGIEAAYREAHPAAPKVMQA